MNAFTLASASIKNRGFHSALCILAMASGVALLMAVFLLSSAVQDGLARNAKGIDVLAGAKGSPIQLVLSSIYHSDIPNGNIDIKDFEQLKQNPQVRQAIPLAMGDSYKGWRIVGTVPEYLEHFDARFSEGRAFDKPFEAVAGASTGLKIGDEFAALHGFAANGDDVHDFHLYKIVGVLKASGTVIDRLITTPYKSVQELHSHPHEHDHDSAEEKELAHQITAVLIKVKSPVSVLNLPREINKSSSLMAVSPSYQMAKLSQSLGMGKDVLVAVSAGIILLSTLMLLSVLTGSLSLRKYDMAILRVMGAPRKMLLLTLMAEGGFLALAGSLIGIVSGHLVAAGIASSLGSLQGVVLIPHLLLPGMLDTAVLIFGTLAGIIAAAVPAVAAKNTNIALILSKGNL